MTTIKLILYVIPKIYLLFIRIQKKSSWGGGKRKSGVCVITRFIRTFLSYFSFSYFSGMSQSWNTQALDSRGSLNLPAPIKSTLVMGAGSPVAIRAVNGVILVVPLTAPAAQALTSGTLDAFVEAQLKMEVAAPAQAVSQSLLIEAERTRRAREKHAQKLQIIEAQTKLHLARYGKTIEPTPELPTAPVSGG